MTAPQASAIMDQGHMISNANTFEEFATHYANIIMKSRKREKIQRSVQRRSLRIANKFKELEHKQSKVKRTRRFRAISALYDSKLPSGKRDEFKLSALKSKRRRELLRQRSFSNRSPVMTKENLSLNDYRPVEENADGVGCMAIAVNSSDANDLTTTTAPIGCNVDVLIPVVDSDDENNAINTMQMETIQKINSDSPFMEIENHKLYEDNNSQKTKGDNMNQLGSSQSGRQIPQQAQSDQCSDNLLSQEHREATSEKDQDFNSRPTPEPEQDAEPQPDAEAQPEAEPQPEVEPQSEAEPQPEPQPEQSEPEQWLPDLSHPSGVKLFFDILFDWGPVVVEPEDVGLESDSTSDSETESEDERQDATRPTYSFKSKSDFNCRVRFNRYVPNLRYGKKNFQLGVITANFGNNNRVKITGFFKFSGGAKKSSFRQIFEQVYRERQKAKGKLDEPIVRHVEDRSYGGLTDEQLLLPFTTNFNESLSEPTLKFDVGTQTDPMFPFDEEGNPHSPLSSLDEIEAADLQYFSRYKQAGTKRNANVSSVEPESSKQYSSQNNQADTEMDANYPSDEPLDPHSSLSLSHEIETADQQYYWPYNPANAEIGENHPSDVPEQQYCSPYNQPDTETAKNDTSVEPEDRHSSLSLLHEIEAVGNQHCSPNNQVDTEIDANYLSDEQLDPQSSLSLSHKIEAPDEQYCCPYNQADTEIGENHPSDEPEQQYCSQYIQSETEIDVNYPSVNKEEPHSSPSSLHAIEAAKQQYCSPNNQVDTEMDANFLSDEQLDPQSSLSLSHEIETADQQYCCPYNQADTEIGENHPSDKPEQQYLSPYNQADTETTENDPSVEPEDRDSSSLLHKIEAAGDQYCSPNNQVDTEMDANYPSDEPLNPHSSLSLSHEIETVDQQYCSPYNQADTETAENYPSDEPEQQYRSPYTQADTEIDINYPSVDKEDPHSSLSLLHETEAADKEYCSPIKQADKKMDANYRSKETRDPHSSLSLLHKNEIAGPQYCSPYNQADTETAENDPSDEREDSHSSLSLLHEIEAANQQYCSSGNCVDNIQDSNENQFYEQEEINSVNNDLVQFQNMDIMNTGDEEVYDVAECTCENEPIDLDETNDLTSQSQDQSSARYSEPNEDVGMRVRTDLFNDNEEMQSEEQSANDDLQTRSITYTVYMNNDTPGYVIEFNNEIIEGQCASTFWDTIPMLLGIEPRPSLQIEEI